jgi:hypothetical protein
VSLRRFFSLIIMIIINSLNARYHIKIDLKPKELHSFILLWRIRISANQKSVTICYQRMKIVLSMWCIISQQIWRAFPLGCKKCQSRQACK